jgi:hypothetical protein
MRSEDRRMDAQHRGLRVIRGGLFLFAVGMSDDAAPSDFRDLPEKARDAMLDFARALARIAVRSELRKQQREAERAGVRHERGSPSGGNL